MAKPNTFRGSNVALFIEDAATPGTFLRPCGLNNHSISFAKNANEVTVPDCDDPELPAWIERETESLDCTGTGTGILAAEAIDLWWGVFQDTNSVNARIYVGKADDTAKGRFWAGKIHITAFDVTGDRGEKAQISVGFASDGELIYTNVT